MLPFTNHSFVNFIHYIYPQRTWDKVYYRLCEVRLITWPTLRDRLKGKLVTKLYDTPNHFSFGIVNFPFICGNVPAIAIDLYNTCSPRLQQKCYFLLKLSWNNISILGHNNKARWMLRTNGERKKKKRNKSKKQRARSEFRSQFTWFVTSTTIIISFLWSIELEWN